MMGHVLFRLHFQGACERPPEESPFLSFSFSGCFMGGQDLQIKLTPKVLQLSSLIPGPKSTTCIQT